MFSSVKAVSSSAESGTKTSQAATATQATSSRCDKRIRASQPPGGDPASEAMLRLTRLNCDDSEAGSVHLVWLEQIGEKLQPLFLFLAGKLDQNHFLGFQALEGIRRVRRHVGAY